MWNIIISLILFSATALPLFWYSKPHSILIGAAVALVYLVFEGLKIAPPNIKLVTHLFGKNMEGKGELSPGLNFLRYPRHFCSFVAIDITEQVQTGEFEADTRDSQKIRWKITFRFTVGEAWKFFRQIGGNADSAKARRGLLGELSKAFSTVSQKHVLAKLTPIHGEAAKDDQKDDQKDPVMTPEEIWTEVKKFFTPAKWGLEDIHVIIDDRDESERTKAATERKLQEDRLAQASIPRGRGRALEIIAFARELKGEFPGFEPPANTNQVLALMDRINDQDAARSPGGPFNLAALEFNRGQKGKKGKKEQMDG